MGRGKGGYTGKVSSYRDSGGNKVTDKGAIFVAERYMDMGYESVFRQKHSGKHTYDLTIKTSDDANYIKNIEVKRVTSSNPSKIASNIKKAGEQISEGETVAIVLPNHRNNQKGTDFAKSGIDEARRKGYIKGPIEVWFSDKTRMEF